MDGQRFDQIGMWLATRDSRRSTLQKLAAGALVIGLSRLGLEEAAAACKKVGQKCDHNHDCCSKKCSGHKCRCRAQGDPCNEWADCCTGLTCSQAQGNTCQPYTLPDLWSQEGGQCADSTDCCSGLVCSKAQGNTCQKPKLPALCHHEGGHCAASNQCCAGLICSKAHNHTCQKLKLPDLCLPTCAQGFACQKGTCVCPHPTIECGGTCVDPGNDPDHCGSCGHQCPTGYLCQGGQCLYQCEGTIVPYGGCCSDSDCRIYDDSELFCCSGPSCPFFTTAPYYCCKKDDGDYSGYCVVP